jgi:hypothetical protein
MSSAPDKTGQIKFTSSSVFRPIKRPTLSVSLLLVWQLLWWLAYVDLVPFTIGCPLCVPNSTANGVPSNPCSDPISFSPAYAGQASSADGSSKNNATFLKNSAATIYIVDVYRRNQMRRRTITTKDGEKLRNIADSLQITLDELTDLENTAGEPGVKQAAISTAMALAWINLVLQLAVERKVPKE